MVAGWICAAALAGTLEVSDRTELRLRYPGVVPGEASVDLETDPDVRLTLASHTTSLVLEYAPQLAAWDMNLVGLHPAYLNRGTGRVEWHGRHLRLALTETASYGLQSYASLALAPGPEGSPARVDVFPTATSFLYESSVTTLEAKWTLRRWVYSASLGYQLAGGATAVAQATLPLQSGPLASASADYSLARTDHMVTTTSGSYASFSTGVDGAILQVDEAWRHSWSRTTTLILRGGAAEAGTRGISAADTPESPQAPFLTETDPVAEVSLRYTFDRGHDGGDVTLDGRLGPSINPLIGLIDERIEGTVAGHYTEGRVGLRAQATLSESVPPSRLTAVRIFYSEVAASYRLSRGASVELGTRTLWQAPTASAAELAAAPPNALYVPVPFLQEVLFAALVVHSDPIHF